MIGTGGLGAPAAQFLAAAGVGTLTICDADHVDLTNLQRQILYATPDVGARKVDAAAQRARRDQSRSAHRARRRSASAPTELAPLVAAADVVLDCCDNFATRHAVEPRLRARAASRWSPARRSASTARSRCSTRATPTSPCYHCLFGEGEELEETRCATMGVFAPLVGIVGATQAAEALKLIAGVGESLAGRLLLLDALAMRWREMRVPRDPACPVCADGQMKRDRARSRSSPALALLVRARARAAPAGDADAAAAEWTAIQQVIGDQLAALKAGDGARR